LEQEDICLGGHLEKELSLVAMNCPSERMSPSNDYRARWQCPQTSSRTFISQNIFMFFSDIIINHTAVKGCHLSSWPQPHLKKPPTEEAVRFRGDGLRDEEGKKMVAQRSGPGMAEVVTCLSM